MHSCISRDCLSAHNMILFLQDPSSTPPQILIFSFLQTGIWLANYLHFTEPEQVLRIRQRQIGDLVGNLSASLLPSNKFYV